MQLRRRDGCVHQYQDVLRRTRVPADVEVGCYKTKEYNNTEGERGVGGVVAHGSSSDTYSLYACQSSPDTRDTHTPLKVGHVSQGDTIVW
jgi:hypothetical protein